MHKFPRWELKRTAATPAQKELYKETRRGKVYFINAVYTHPGKPGRKRKATAAAPPASKKKKEKGGGERCARKGAEVAAAQVPTGDRKSPPELIMGGKSPPEHQLRGKSSLQPEARGGASSALDEAIQSAADDARGDVDPDALRRAMDAGYSRQFVLDKIAAHLDSIKDTKPPAKKKAKAGGKDSKPPARKVKTGGKRTFGCMD